MEIYSLLKCASLKDPLYIKVKLILSAVIYINLSFSQDQN